MKAPLIALALSVLAAAALPPAHAADATPGAAPPASAPDKAPTAQQDRMVACQRQASERHLDGTMRQAHVNDCLRNKPAAASAPSHGVKLGACSREAAAQGLKGEARNRFLSTCARS